MREEVRRIQNSLGITLEQDQSGVLENLLTTDPASFLGQLRIGIHYNIV